MNEIKNDIIHACYFREIGFLNFLFISIFKNLNAVPFLHFGSESKYKATATAKEILICNKKRVFGHSMVNCTFELWQVQR